MMVTLDILKEVVCNQMGVSSHVLEFKNGNEKVRDAKRLFVGLAIDVCNYRQCHVTRYLENFNHTTILSLLKISRELQEGDLFFRTTYTRIKNAIELDSELDNINPQSAIIRLKVLRQEVDEKIQQIDQLIEYLSNNNHEIE